MDDLLFLVHRIPFPPNKGDKIRSYHLLRFLAERYRVHLGAFIDDPGDWQYADALRRLCTGQVCLLDLPSWRGYGRALTGLAREEPLTVAWYRDPRMQRWVAQRLARDPIRLAIGFSSAMALYLPDGPGSPIRRIMDFTDVDSRKWQQMAMTAPWWWRWIYRREAERLLAFDRRVAAVFDASLFVTGAEAELFRSLAPESAHRVDYWENGVDSAMFDPELPLENPYPPGGPIMVFVGLMDYHPNVEAVRFFGREVLPLIRQQIPEVRFAVVGSRPVAQVRRLAEVDGGILVTGGVPDVRPYLAHAQVATIPIRIARGIQNKVLEAMAMAKPVVTTSMVAGCLRREPSPPLLVADGAEAMAQAVIGLLQDPIGIRETGKQARRWVVEHYQWEVNLKKLELILSLPGLPSGS